MTDAALTVTQSAVEQFTRRYLESLGCSIAVQGDRWIVTVPEEADFTVESAELTLICSTDQENVARDTRLLHPESSFFQNLLEEATDRAPIGSMSLTADNVDLQLPGWATESDAEITNAAFLPYYDRIALTFLFHISIETVSEYQTQLLRAVSFDVRSREILPGITREYLDQTDTDCDDSYKHDHEISDGDICDLLKTASEEIRNQIQPDIVEIHENASQAADDEFEEYRYLQKQRIEELDKSIATAKNQISELSNTLQNAENENERVKILRQRKNLKSDINAVQKELAELKQRHETGFPKKQQEIHDRHSLNVRLDPVVITVVEYETGDLELTLTAGSIVESVTVGYACGVGVIESITCKGCGQTLTSKNPIQLAKYPVSCLECIPSSQ